MEAENRIAVKVADFTGVTVNLGGQLILDNINLTIRQQEQWAIVGESGSGKTTLANVMAGKMFSSGKVDYYFGNEERKGIEIVEQQHHFKNLSNVSNFYYQQRFNASDAEDSITVAEALAGYTDADNWIGVLQIEELMNEPLLQLSNGENKRLQLAKALLKNPGLLILDNPFIGLDTEGRKILNTILDKISQKGIHLILITTTAELPSCVTHVAVLEKGKLISAQAKENYHTSANASKRYSVNKELVQHLQQSTEADFAIAIKMKNVRIKYGDKTILHNINWEVKKGECWNLSGPNGAGKSTLLSLITADNPQAYANNIILFDKQRGTNESIWDIKKKIGFVSPELHLYFLYDEYCFNVIASGLFDTIGLFRQLTETQETKVLLWMHLMGLADVKDKRMYQLSTSQQRMALLARALIKNPPLLILDEPTQGLDEEQTNYFKELVNKLCGNFQTTLIYVSHYAKDIPSCVNHFLQLKNGEEV